MTSYLQRLFDRTAGLAAGPAAALSPSFSSRSPVAEADQRLNLPDLAASLLALSPSIDAPSLNDDDAFARIEDAPVRARRPALPDDPVLTPASEAREAAHIAAPVAPLRESASETPRNDRPSPRERPAPLSAAEPTAQPIPSPPRALPQSMERTVPHEQLQRPQAEIPASLVELIPMPVLAKTEERVIRHLEPVPLPLPEPLPAPAPPPRDTAELRQPTVTRREIVMAPAPEPIAPQPSRTMPATAESVSRIGKLTPRRRAQLVFGLRRR